jgi:hypothetical protein
MATPTRAVVIAILLLSAWAGLASAGSRGGARFVGKGFGGHGRGLHAPKSVFPVPVDPWKSWGRAPTRRFHGGFTTPFVAPSFSSLLAVPAWGTVYAPGVAYASIPPPAYAAPPVASPPSLPTPTTIEYPTGWYQLRGDGVTAAYTWVWIPKPPPPAVAPEPTPPPSASAPPPAVPPTSTEPPRTGPRSDAYRWTDEQGVTTWTNRLERVPRRYRDQAAASVEP